MVEVIDECIAAILCYFEHCGCMVPLYNQPSRQADKLSHLPEEFRPVDPTQFLASLGNDQIVIATYTQLTKPLLKGVVVLIVEGERLYLRFHAAIQKLHREYWSANYRNTDWPRLVKMHYVHLFLRWMSYLYCRIEPSGEETVILSKAGALKETFVDMYVKLIMYPDRSELSKALIFDSLDDVCGNMRYLNSVAEFLWGEANKTHVPHERTSFPLTEIVSKEDIMQIMLQPEIMEIYKRLCEVKGNYILALSDAIDNARIIQSPHGSHGLTLSNHQILIEELESQWKHPGLILGFTIMTFMHEFSHFFRQYSASSIGQFYQSGSPRRLSGAN